MYSAYAVPRKAVYPNAACFSSSLTRQVSRSQEIYIFETKTLPKRNTFAVTEILSHKILCPLFPLPVHLIFETIKNIACNFDFPGLVPNYGLHAIDTEHIRLNSVNRRYLPPSFQRWLKSIHFSIALEAISFLSNNQAQSFDSNRCNTSVAKCTLFSLLWDLAANPCLFHYPGKIKLSNLETLNQILYIP